jgi:hypothetical protein
MFKDFGRTSFALALAVVSTLAVSSDCSKRCSDDYNAELKACQERSGGGDRERCFQIAGDNLKRCAIGCKR